MPVTCDPGCRVTQHSDAARRCADAVNLHRTALGFDAVGRWVAVRLSDGGSDGTSYDSKRDAVRHQLDEKLCAYVRVSARGMNVCQAESFLSTNRRLYDAGFRLTDPDDRHGGRSVIPRLTVADQVRSMAALRR